jgi:hypothetical protein
VSTAAERRRQKALEKAKKRREDARRTRSVTRGRAPEIPEVLGPLVTAFASSNWADRGAQVRAAIARPDAAGRLVAALITADLTTASLVVAVESRVPAAGWDARVSAHGGELTMVQVEPALVARLVQQCREWHADAEIEGLGAVRRLLEGIRAADHPHPFLLGEEPAEPPMPTWTERIASFFRR